MSTPMVISTKEARELMPQATYAMEDEEVVSLINSLELLASAFIKMTQNDKSYS